MVQYYSCLITHNILPPVAKLDIAADSDSEGRGFESLRAGQQKRNFCLPKVPFLFIQAAGLAYHHRTKCGAYHQKADCGLLFVYHHALACILSPKVHFFGLITFTPTVRFNMQTFKHIVQKIKRYRIHAISVDYTYVLYLNLPPYQVRESRSFRQFHGNRGPLQIRQERFCPSNFL